MQRYKDIARYRGFTRFETIELPFVLERADLFDEAEIEMEEKLKDSSLIMYSDDPATVYYLANKRLAKTNEELYALFSVACGISLRPPNNRTNIIFVFGNEQSISYAKVDKNDLDDLAVFDGTLKRRNEHGRDYVVCYEVKTPRWDCRHCTATMCADCAAKVNELDGCCPICRK